MSLTVYPNSAASEGVAAPPQFPPPPLAPLHRSARDEPVSERVREHLEHLVARGERPAVRHLDQRERLAVLVEVDAGGAPNVRNYDQRPVTHRDVLQSRKVVQGGADLPDRAEVACD